MENIVEEWRPIVGYENYEVSDYGRVKNVRTGNIKKSFCHKEYLQIFLKKKLFRVHRLVARAFPDICGEWFEGCVINHKNEIKTDNRACNIEVCTVSFNNRFGSRLQKVSKTLTNRPDLSKSVSQYTLDGKLVATYPSLSEAARQTKISVQCIYSACKGKSKTAGGFIWRYA